MNNFILGKKSLAELKGVHSDLVAVVKRSIELTVQDFSVHDGIRTLEEQRVYLERGVSHTLTSRHISGHAVDLVPYINGKLRWEMLPIYDIVVALRLAAQEHDVPIRWGGAWDINLTDTDAPPEDLVADYVARRRRAQKRPFIDGPHFELPTAAYPEPAL